MSVSEPNSQDYYEYDVFLSHNHAQRNWAYDLAQRFREAGLKVCFREWPSQTEENWIREFVRGVEESRKVILVLSPEFLDQQWPIFDIHIPILKDPSARRSRFVPLIHTDCNLPLELVSHQTLDFSDTHDNALRYEFRLAQLMADLDKSRERPTDFDLFCATYEELSSDALPPVGQLPVGSLMLFLPNPNFVGREAELTLLYKELEATDSVSLAQTVALTGMCGVGKTQLAAEFIYRYGRRFSGGVFWLDASEASKIPSEVAHCAGVEGMDLPGAGSLSQDELVALVMREWRGSQQRLVVFDGLENLDIMDNWRPASAGTRVLITARIDGNDPQWREQGIRTIPIDVLPREQSVELLCRGRREALDSIDGTKAANAICELLGDLPLALHLAGAHLSRYRYEIGLQDYLFELSSRPILLNPAFSGSVCDPTFMRRYQSLSAMFGDIVSRIDQSDEAQNTDLMAVQLLHLISHFAPVPISRSLLTQALKMDEDKSADRRKVADAVNRLCELGLVQSQSDGCIKIHKLVRGFAYEHPAHNQDANKVAEDIARAMSNFISETTHLEHLERKTEDLEHLRYVARESEHRGSQLTSTLYNQLAYNLRKNGDLEGAKRFYSRALEISEAIHGPDHQDVAIIVNNLGTVLQEIGDLEEAEKRFRWALNILEQRLGVDHPKTLTAKRNLQSLQNKHVQGTSTE